jgi:hypothetical protein
MTEVKHTPGPWKREDRFVYALMPDQKRHGQEVNRFWLSVQPQAGYGVPDAEIDANANLIAAAPELLEALKSAVLSWEESHNPPSEWAHPEWYAKAKFAISKAESTTL